MLRLMVEAIVNRINWLIRETGAAMELPPDLLDAVINEAYGDYTTGMDMANRDKSHLQGMTPDSDNTEQGRTGTDVPPSPHQSSHTEDQYPPALSSDEIFDTQAPSDSPLPAKATEQQSSDSTTQRPNDPMVAMRHDSTSSDSSATDTHTATILAIADINSDKQKDLAYDNAIPRDTQHSTSPTPTPECEGGELYDTGPLTQPHSPTISPTHPQTDHSSTSPNSSSSSSSDESSYSARSSRSTRHTRNRRIRKPLHRSLSPTKPSSNSLATSTTASATSSDTLTTKKPIQQLLDFRPRRGTARTKNTPPLATRSRTKGL